MANYDEYLEYLRHIDNTSEQEIASRIEGLNNEILSLKTSLSNLNKNNDQLATELHKTKRTLSEKESVLAQTEMNLNREKASAQDTQKKLETTVNDLETTRKKLSDSEKLLLGEQKRGLDLANEIKGLLVEGQNKEKENAKLLEKINEKSKEIARLNNEHLNLLNVYNELNKHTEEVSVEFKKTNSELSNERDNIQKLHKILTDKSIHIEKLQADNERLSDMMKTHKEKQDELHKLLNDKSIQVEKLQADNERLSGMMKTDKDSGYTDKKEIEALKEVIKTQNSTIKNLEVQKNDITNNLEQIKQQKTKVPKKTLIKGALLGMVIMMFVWILFGGNQNSREESNIQHDMLTGDSAAVYSNSGYVTEKYFDMGDSSHSFQYTGQVLNNIPNGMGKAIYNDGHFEGVFENGAKLYGTRVFKNGGVYVGSYKNEKANGYGSYKYKDGSMYVGEFSYDKLDGFGRYYDKNGNIVAQGKFANDKFLK